MKNIYNAPNKEAAAVELEMCIRDSRNTGTDKKQYIGAVLSAWKEILFPIVGTVAFYNCSIY